MTGDELDQPFDTLESAIDFMGVLAETILDAKKDLHSNHELALQEGQERRAQAIEIAVFKLKILSGYVFKSRIALNDLRTIRRLLLEERKTPRRTLTATASA